MSIKLSVRSSVVTTIAMMAHFFCFEARGQINNLVPIQMQPYILLPVTKNDGHGYADHQSDDKLHY